MKTACCVLLLGFLCLQAFSQVGARPSLCNLPPKAGWCYLNMERYFYNTKTRKCQQFVYGGCGGNLNRFYNIEACKKTCAS
ncbi:hypothetical protein BsWGS_08906 [Bradybaena similaris]